MVTDDAKNVQFRKAFQTCNAFEFLMRFGIIEGSIRFPSKGQSGKPVITICISVASKVIK